MTVLGRSGPALHLVRHGETSWNVQRLVQGQTDHPELTDLGRAQIRWAADLLAGVGATRLLTSDLRRAMHSAENIGAAIGLQPISTSLLREQSCGWVEGWTTDRAVIEWDRMARDTVDEYGDPVAIADLRLGGGESMRDVLVRVNAVLALPWVTEATSDVVIVSHADVIRLILGNLLGDDPDEPNWRVVGNGDVHSVYRTSGGQPVHVHSAATVPTIPTVPNVATVMTIPTIPMVPTVPTHAPVPRDR